MKKTGYEWSLEANLRILNLDEWNGGEKAYFEEPITLTEFYNNVNNCRVKPNSQPRKTDNYLEYRMYGLVPYNISPIQQAIQYGHAVVEYGRMVRNTPHEDTYNLWADKHKTFIILNGGTTNKNPERLGTLNQHANKLTEAEIVFDCFYEPDLGDQLTAIVFLVDERVFNKTLYPDFEPETLPSSQKKPTEKTLSLLEAKNNKNYELWVDKIGGSKNAFLRDFLKSFRLA